MCLVHLEADLEDTRDGLKKFLLVEAPELLGVPSKACQGSAALTRTGAV